MAISPGAMSAFRSTVYLGLGSNLDDPVRQVQTAMREIDEIPDTGLVKISSLYQTMPVGVLDQPAFINAVVQLETILSPYDLLAHLLELEARHSRVRNEKNGPRTLDLDILIFNEWQIDDNKLTVPHPRMHERAFVIAPLVEIAPDILIMGKGYARELISRLDTSGVRKLGTA